MIFRFTLNNTIEGSQVISNPDGWKEIKLKLERDKEYHSLVEMVELPLIFCGSDGTYDGGYDYIRNIEDTQGVDAQIEILIEVSDNGGAYETFFDGLLQLETIKEISDAEPYKLECNIVRTDLWSKFIKRKSQDVNLNGTTSIDGDSLTPIYDINLSLPGQRIRKNSHHKESFGTAFDEQSVSTNDYIQIGFDNSILDEATIKNNILTDINSTLPVEIFTPEYSGNYTFEVNVPMSVTGVTVLCDASASPFVIDPCSTYVDWYIQKNSETAIQLTETDVTDGTQFYCSETFNLVVNDVVRVYGIVTSSAWETLVSSGYIQRRHLFIWGQDNSRVVTYQNDACTATLINYGSIPTGLEAAYMRITADTDYPSTETDAFLLRDAAESILSKIISRNNVVYSNYLGDETPTACAANFAIMKGLHVRGYTMADKPMFMNFDDWWAGANPIFNLGLGYETIGGTEYIRIEDKGHFYDEDYSLTLSNVDKITRVYDRDKIFKSIEIGYEKWSAESASGVDDPQTKHTYNTRFKIIGKDERVLSKFIAASLAIEQTRRNRIEFGRDWRLDEDVIIIALSADSTPYQPETDEAFSAITGLLNSSTRYNIRLTPSRNFERWKPYFNGCLQLYIPENYTFASGEGNYDMQSTGDELCDSGTLAENQDISVTTSFYHGAGSYEFQYYMSWEDYKTVRDNRNKAIRVSNTTSNYKTCFIDSMEYDHYNSIADFTVWIKE